MWIVDDSQADAERAALALRQVYGTRVFHDGSAALEAMAHDGPPDVLVLDWVMPGISGVEVCRFLRSQTGGGLPHLGVLMLTAQRDTEQVVEGLDAGANDFLCKPWEDAELRARVKSLVRTRTVVERLERAEARSHQLLEDAPDPLITVDASGRLTYANPEASRVLGRSDLAGTRIADVLPGLSLGAPTRPSVAPQPLPDVKVGERVVSPIMRAQPERAPGAMTIALRDVTDRRRDDTRRLDLYTIAAHDLRTPLGAITMRLELLRRGKHGALSSGMIAELQKIDGNLGALMAMIDDFLALARLHGTDHRLAGTEVDLAARADEVLEELAPLVEAGGLTARRVPAEGDFRVRADRRRIAQVVTNLVANAIKFTPQKGQVRVELARRAGEVELAVIDTGPGIAEEDQVGHFQRYTRFRPEGDAVRGSGLGLMIVREIVQAHGGDVGVESQVGKGSRFWLRLPAFDGRES